MPRQPRLPEMELPSVAEIDEAAETYRELRDSRMSMQKREAEAHAELLELMKSHGLKDYEFDGYVVSVVSSEKVRVRKSKEDDGDGDGDE